MVQENGKTFLKKKQQVERKWLIFDASGKTLGRFACEIAKVLRGKHRPDYTPHVDSGDGVIIVNADKIRVTGSKRQQKIYRYYSGLGNLKEIPFDIMQARKPAYIIENAVWGMLPSNRLRKHQMSRLRIYTKDAHNIHAQKPTKVEI